LSAESRPNSSTGLARGAIKQGRAVCSVSRDGTLPAISGRGEQAAHPSDDGARWAARDEVRRRRSMMAAKTGTVPFSASKRPACPRGPDSVL